MLLLNLLIPVIVENGELLLQDLIKLICDVKSMEDAVVEMKYDAKKAPLGSCQSFRNGENSHWVVVWTSKNSLSEGTTERHRPTCKKIVLLQEN